MKVAGAAVAAGFAASLCCIGPVLGVLVGMGAAGAASSRLLPLRPYLLVVTAGLLGLAFYQAYRPAPIDCADGVCPPASTRRARLLVWIAAILVVLFLAFPWYVKFII